MKFTQRDSILSDTQEEIYEEYDRTFPHVAIRAMLGHYHERTVPWHWHGAAELFYLKSGTLTYHTPQGTCRFEEGSCGLLLPNVLHKTTWDKDAAPVQWLHQFDTALLFGSYSQRMAEKYVLPLFGDDRPDLLRLDERLPEHRAIADRIVRSFSLDETDFRYEWRLREALCEIWLDFYAISEKHQGAYGSKQSSNETVKRMIIYLREHFQEKTDIRKMAEELHIGVRTGYRLFREVLHTTPNEYVRSCRVQYACKLLAEREKSIMEIVSECGFENASYFGKVFKDATGMTPTDYRELAQK